MSAISGLNSSSITQTLLNKTPPAPTSETPPKPRGAEDPDGDNDTVGALLSPATAGKLVDISA